MSPQLRPESSLKPRLHLLARPAFHCLLNVVMSIVCLSYDAPQVPSCCNFPDCQRLVTAACLAYEQV